MTPVGPIDRVAVKKHQKLHWLQVDGIVGAQTWKHLEQVRTNLFNINIRRAGDIARLQAEVKELKAYATKCNLDKMPEKASFVLPLAIGVVVAVLITLVFI